MWDEHPRQEIDEDCPAMQFSLAHMGCRKKKKAWEHAVNSCLMKFHGDRRVPAESLNQNIIIKIPQAGDSIHPSS